LELKPVIGIKWMAIFRIGVQLTEKRVNYFDPGGIDDSEPAGAPDCSHFKQSVDVRWLRFSAVSMPLFCLLRGALLPAT